MTDTSSQKHHGAPLARFVSSRLILESLQFRKVIKLTSGPLSHPLQVEILYGRVKRTLGRKHCTKDSDKFLSKLHVELCCKVKMAPGDLRLGLRFLDMELQLRALSGSRRPRGWLNVS